MSTGETRIDQVVIVGAGLAGVSAAEELRKAGHEGTITLVGSEQHPPYDRPPMSKEVMLGKVAIESTALHPEEWYVEHDIQLLTGQEVIGLDLGAQRVRTLDRSIPYDRLLVATGSRARRLPQVDDSGAEVPSPNKWQALYILGQIYHARRDAASENAWREVGRHLARVHAVAECVGVPEGPHDQGYGERPGARGQPTRPLRVADLIFRDERHPADALSYRHRRAVPERAFAAQESRHRLEDAPRTNSAGRRRKTRGGRGRTVDVERPARSPSGLTCPPPSLDLPRELRNRQRLRAGTG